MGNEWGIPNWRQEGRTGPGPVAPKYASAKDRRAVRRGGSPGSQKGKANMGKKGGKSGGGKQPTNGPYHWGNGPQPKGRCCFAGQAVKAVWMGKFRLARRFARLDVKTRLGLLT